MNCNKFQPFWAIVLLTIIPTLIFWSIFYFNLPSRFGYADVSLKTIFANYDGPNYMVIAKCGYNPTCIRSQFSLPTPLEYYPAHLPGFPYMIRALNYLIPGPIALILLGLIGSVVLNLAFYSLTKSLWLTFVFTLFPARLFILRSIGAPETFFVGFFLWSIIFFKQKKYLLSAIFVALAQTIKSPAVLLFVAYFLLAAYQWMFQKHSPKVLLMRYFPYLLVPLTALLIFTLYYFQTGDFLAYFHSGDNIHLNLLPYLSLVSTQTWVNGFWLEDIVYIYFFALAGIIRLFGQRKMDIIAIFPAIFLIASIFVAHRDISRYIAPLYPFAFIAFASHFHTKAFKLAFIVLIPAIFLYAINFVIGNTAPIADWTPYL